MAGAGICTAATEISTSDPISAKGAVANFEIGEKTFLRQTILGRCEDHRIGQDRLSVRDEEIGGLRRNIFKFERDQIAAIRETGKGFFVVERRARSFADNIERTGIRFRRINMTMNSETLRCLRKHAPQLAAAKNPEGRARFQNGQIAGHGGGSAFWTLAD